MALTGLPARPLKAVMGVTQEAERSSKSSLTVIIPAYNEASSIGDTICSLQQQTRAPAEILVVDDCSTDETAAIASGIR